MSKSWVVLGVDIGGTTTKFGFVDMYGRCYNESSLPTRADEPAEFLIERLHQAVETEWDALDEEFQLVGIGIGAPNANFYKGTVENPPNLKWGVVSIVDLLRKFYDEEIPIKLTNDANAAALGEMQFGAAQGMKDFIVITLGTGLGSGIVVGGEMVYGHDGFAGEMGHTVAIRNGRSCGCGRKGCLETYASASGIRRTVMELLAEKTEPSEMRSISFSEMNGKVIAEAAKKGDPIAWEAFQRTGKTLGLALADAINYTSPEAIIMIGGLAQAGDILFKPTKETMEANTLSIFKGKVKLLPSGLKNGNIAILGAAALIWHEILVSE